MPQTPIPVPQPPGYTAQRFALQEELPSQATLHTETRLESTAPVTANNLANEINRSANSQENLPTQPTPSSCIREFPDVPAESMAFVEKMMLNLRRASEKSG
jgi:hypothetical protein